MKFGQLIELTWETFFLKNRTKCGRETILRPFSNKSKLSISLDQYSKVLYVLITCHVEDYRKWLKLSCRPFAFTSYKAILKNKKRSETSLPVSFSTWFLKKNISDAIFYYLTKFQCLVAFTSWDFGQYVYCNCLLTRLWRQQFRNWPYLSN